MKNIFLFISIFLFSYPSLFAQEKHTDSTVLRPMIKLVIRVSSSTSERTFSGGRQKGGGVTSSSRHFLMIDPETGKEKSVGFRQRRLEKYVKADEEAYKILKSSRRAGTIDVVSGVVFVASATAAAVSLANGDADEAAPAEYGLILVAIVSGIVQLWVGWIDDTSIKRMCECVKVYNRNAGYGYINGLEEKKE